MHDRQDLPFKWSYALVCRMQSIQITQCLCVLLWSGKGNATWIRGLLLHLSLKGLASHLHEVMCLDANQCLTLKCRRKQLLAKQLIDILEEVTETVHKAYFVDLFVRASNAVAIAMYNKVTSPTPEINSSVNGQSVLDCSFGIFSKLPFLKRNLHHLWQMQVLMPHQESCRMGYFSSHSKHVKQCAFNVPCRLWHSSVKSSNGVKRPI